MPESTDLLKQQTTYTFKYESDSDTIDLNTLLLSQLHFATVLNEIKTEVAPESNLTIKVKPLEKGSVPFDIVLDISWLQSLFANETLSGIGGLIIGTLSYILAIRLALKGKKPDQIEVTDDFVIITKGDVVIKVSRQAYEISQKNAVVDAALKKSFEVIEKDEDVTGIEIQDGKKQPIIEIPRERFEDFTTPNEVFEEYTLVEDPKIETVTVFKVVFEKGYKWQFYLNGRKVSATMQDSDYIDRIKNSGESFSYGDTLDVELQVEKVLDKNLDIYVEKDIKVLKVIGHTRRGSNSSQQTKLFPPNEPEA